MDSPIALSYSFNDIPLSIFQEAHVKSVKHTVIVKNKLWIEIFVCPCTVRYDF